MVFCNVLLSGFRGEQTAGDDNRTILIISHFVVLKNANLALIVAAGDAHLSAACIVLVLYNRDGIALRGIAIIINTVTGGASSDDRRVAINVDRGVASLGFNTTLTGQRTAIDLQLAGLGVINS